MFSKSEDNGTGPESTPHSHQSQQQIRRSPARSAAPSIISSDMTIVGTVKATGDVQVDCKIDGDIYSSSLTIGETAVINGEVRADEIVIKGQVIGGIRARKVSLASTCYVEGNLCHNALQMETGAFFQGNIKHSNDPLSENPPEDPRSNRAGGQQGDAAQGAKSAQIDKGASANDQGEPPARSAASGGGGSQQGASNQQSRPPANNSTNNAQRKAQGRRN